MPAQRIRPRVASGVLALLVMGALLACQDAAPGDGEAAPRQGGTAVILASADLQAANPLVSSEAWTDQVNVSLLFMPLLRYTPELEYAPYLARSWELEGDSVALFRLREDVTWHDGVPTTAEDVAFTFRRALDPQTAFPNVTHFVGWRDVEVLDSFTVRVRFTPRLEPLLGVPLLGIVPRHLLDSIPPDELRRAAFNKRPVGNGPFRFVSQSVNERWVFEANDAFPEELGGRPHLDRLIWRVLPDPTAQVAEMRTGRGDLLLGIGMDQFTALDTLPGLRGIARQSGKYTFIGWNNRRPPLDDPRVRQALALAMDRTEIIQIVRRGQAELAVGPVAPEHWAAHPDLEPLPFTPDSARALLAAAGIENRDADPWLELPGGGEMEIELTIPSGVPSNQAIAQIVQSDLADIGVRVEIRVLDPSSYFATFAAPPRDFDAAVVGLSAPLDLNLRDPFHSGRQDAALQMAGYANPEVDSLLDAVAAARTREQAGPALHRVQEILLAEQPWSILYYYPDLFVVAERLRGVQMDLRGALVGVGEWWLEEERGDTSAVAPEN
ncbi:MAG TPA: ABC transporter substrate-binding protein [Longimicrobiales bacterium]|nr:ABC transporter substrate-binding protein [Longimicrobiales bacterium]